MNCWYSCGVTTWTQPRIAANPLPENDIDWPWYVPTSSARNHVVVSWPGTASTWPPSAGMNQRWVTSVDVKCRRTVVSTGTVSSL